MLNEKKFKNLYQFLTNKNSSSSKKLSINIRSETTSPSSYNDRNYSTQNKPFNNDINNKNNQINQYLVSKKSNTIDKNCYNNINLLNNLKENEDNTTDSFSKDLNKSNLSNASKLSIISISKNKNSGTIHKSLFFQIMKYYTRKSKTDAIKNEQISFFLKPIENILNNQKKNSINIKNIKKELEDKNMLNIGKKGIIHKHNSIDINKLENNFDINKLNSNEKINYIGLDDNFNLTFGKSSNKIEIFTSGSNRNNIKNNIKKTKSKINNNCKFNINNFKNNINAIKNKKTKNNNIEIGGQSQRNSDPPILISEKIMSKKIIDNYNNSMSKEESTPSFLNESKKENEKKNSTQHQFKTRRINLPKNPINLENIKSNNQILKNLLNHKKNILNGNKKNVNDFDSSRIKIMDKKSNMKEEIKNNNNFNLNHFNRNYSGKKKYK